MEDNKKIVINKVVSLAVSFVVILMLVLFINKYTDLFKPEVITTPTPIPSEFPDYEAFKNMSKKLTITKDHEAYTPKLPSGYFEYRGRITQQLITSGSFSQIYLYVDASVDNGKPLTQWDSIYMSLGIQSGHLFRVQSLKVPKTTNETTTKLLFAINQVPLIANVPYSENKIPYVVDWFKLFQKGAIIRFDTFLSSLRPGGKFNLIELRYECAPDTACEIR